MSSRGTQGLTSHGQSPLSRRRWIKMPGYVTRFLELLVFLALPMTVRTITVPFYWNSSNPLFHTDHSENVMDFWEGDSLTLICPYYPKDDPRSPQDWEYYIAYMVSQQMYDQCVINDVRNTDWKLYCGAPASRHSGTILMMAFSPTGTDFVKGSDYYIISTSGGRESNMDNMYHGVCKNNNMRLKLSFHGRREMPDTSGGTGSSDGGNNNNNQPDSPRTQPTQPPTERRTTTTTTTTVATTRRPVVSTDPATQPTIRRPKPLGGGAGSGGGDDSDPVPGSDGFPSDETVIHAGGGANRGGRDSNINSGVIEDSSATDSGMSSLGQYRSSYSLCRHWALALGLVISYVLAHTDFVRGR